MARVTYIAWPVVIASCVKVFLVPLLKDAAYSATLFSCAYYLPKFMQYDQKAFYYNNESTNGFIRSDC